MGGGILGCIFSFPGTTPAKVTKKPLKNDGWKLRAMVPFNIGHSLLHVLGGCNCVSCRVKGCI